MAAWRLQRNSIAIDEIVTFGSPMIGNDAAARAFEREFRGRIFRYVNLEDPVPLLPSISLIASSYLIANSYSQCQAEVSMRSQAVASTLDPLRDSPWSEGEPLLGATNIENVWQGVHAPHLCPFHGSLPGVREGAMLACVVEQSCCEDCGTSPDR